MSFGASPILSLFIAVLFAGPTFANNASVTSGTTTIQAPKKDGHRWSGFINSSRSTNLIDHHDGTRSDGLDYLARLNFKLSNKYFLRLQTGYSQNLNDSELNDFSDTSLSLIRNPTEMGPYFLASYRFGVTAPTSKTSNKGESLINSLGTGADLIINPNLLISGLEVVGSFRFNRNFHKYDTALSGEVNTQYNSSQGLSVAYSLKSGVSFSASFTHINTWSYQNIMRTGFLLTQEISYEVNPTVIIAAGHTNTGSTLKANGTDSNIALINENTSIIYGSLTLVF